MKKMLIMLACILPLTMLSAQNPVSDFIQSQSGKENLTIVNVNPAMLEMMAGNGEEISKDDLAKLKSKFTGMNILVAENNSQIFDEFNKAVDLSKYETFMSVSGEEYVRMVGNMKDGRFQDFILVVNESSEQFVLLSITGDFTMEDIGMLGGMFDMDLENMMK